MKPGRDATILPHPFYSHLVQPSLASANYPQTTCCKPPLTYNDGPVLHHPRVYLDFWGPKWHQDTDNVIPAMQTLFQNLAHTPYNNILTQYTDKSGDYVHSDVTLAGTWIDDQSSPPDGTTFGAGGLYGDIYHEAVGSLTSFNPNKWTNAPDTIFMVFPQKGTHYSGDLNNICGEHDQSSGLNSIIYSFGRYPSDTQGCDFGTTLAGSMTTTAAHEYAEAATDPAGTGWKTGDSGLFSANEIGDLCEYSDFSFHSYTAQADIQIQPLWDNSKNECAARDINSITPGSSMAQNDRRVLEMFDARSDGNIYHNYQNNANGTWLGWSQFSTQGGLGTSPTPPILGRNKDGRLEVFTIGLGTAVKGKMFHSYQTAPNSAWSPLQEMPPLPTNIQFSGSPAVISNGDGRLEVFALGSDGNIWHSWQVAPDSWWGDWAPLNTLPSGVSFTTNLPTISPSPVVAFNESDNGGPDNDKLDIFDIGNDGNIWHNYQVGNQWSGWQKMTTSGDFFAGLQAITVSRNDDGHLEVFALRNGYTVWHSYQKTAADESSWSDWSLFPAIGNLFNPTAMVDSQNHLTLFAYNPSTNRMEYSAQKSVNDSTQWSAWSELAQPNSLNMAFFGSPNPVVAHNSNGGLDVEGIVSNGSTWLNTSEILNAQHARLDWTPWGQMVGAHILLKPECLTEVRIENAGPMISNSCLSPN